MERIELAVGKPLPSTIKLINREEISTIDLLQDKKFIFNGIPNVMPQDLYIFNNGKLNIGAFKHKNTIVFSTSLEEYSTHGGKLSTENIYHPFIEDSPSYDFQQEYLKVATNKISTYDFVYVLFDTVNRVVYGIRVFTVDRNFTIQLAKMLAEIGNRSITGKEFLEVQLELHSKYSTEQVAQFCTIRTSVK